MFIDHYTISKRFWDGMNKSEVILSFDEDGKIEAINRAIGDLMERTLKRKTASQGDRDEEIRNALLPKINEWFKKPEIKITEIEFDKWHNEACNAVLKVLQKFYTNNDNQKTPVQYGKAQKIVNMTMKGIYCLKGADAYEKHFEFCHMALDSFTLEWFRRYIATQWFNADDKKRVIKIKISEDNGPFPRWSNLNFKEGSLLPTYKNYEENPNLRTHKDKYHYMFFVQTIREYISYINKDQPSRLTPLQAEFFIWEEMQIHIAMEKLYSLGGKEKDFKNKSICEKIPALQAFLDELKNSFSSN